MKILSPDPDKHNLNSDITSYLSFYPYYKHLQERIQNPAEQFSGIYRLIAEKLEAFPQLLQPFNKPGFIQNHEEIFQLIASTIIPFSSDKDLQYFALGTPYKVEMLFYSHSFSEYFGSDNNGYIIFPAERPFHQIQTENFLMAYRMVFRKFFNFELVIPEKKINGWIDKVTGLRRYSRIHIDESFIDIKLLGELPAFPEKLINKHTSTVTDLDQLREQLPLALFSFEGFMIRRSIADVTTEVCITELRNTMIEMQSENSTTAYDDLRSTVETLVGIINVDVSLSPYIKLNGKFIYYDKYSGRSILLKSLPSAEQREKAYLEIASILDREKRPLYLNNPDDPTAEIKTFPLAKYFERSRHGCYLAAPVFYDNELIGMIEIASTEACVLNNQTINKLEPVYPFFKMMCVNHGTKFKTEIDSLIKEKYTALLPVVEWKFLEQALLYLKEKEKKNNFEIGAIHFKDVYPFYGAVDVKDSALKRGRCFQKDILEQINLTDLTLNVLKEHLPKDLVANLMEKNNAFRQIAEQGYLIKNEERMTRFFEFEIKSFFNQLPFTNEIIAEAIIFYLRSVDPVSGHLNKNRKAFDESIGKLNKAIAEFLETEEHKIQQLHPHYFEKRRSDGVEYNIYLGQSLHHNKVFNPTVLKKIRLWQLSVMAYIARITHSLQKKLAIPLQTTQLILAYANPICISFRKDERRFDVEGAESIYFEILKKRIDKVRIKNTGERLTKPGCIAIVYTNPQEIEEYNDHVYFLRKNDMITNEIEMLELEDLQGISGLKAIRLNVNVETGVTGQEMHINSSFENFPKIKLSGIPG